MKISIVFFLFSSVAFSQESFFLNYNVKKDNEIVLEAFYKFINIKDVERSSLLWNKSQFFEYPDNDFLDISRNAINHNMTILSTSKIEENKYNLKVAWIKNNNGYGNLYAIYNLTVKNDNGKVSFENVLDENVKDFVINQVSEIKYLSYKGHKFNFENAQSMIDFNTEIATFFSTDKKRFTYILCKSMEDLKKVRGFDFDPMMVEDNQIGGEAFPHDNLIFAGNNSEFYPHEVVHLYTYSNFKRIHIIIDEGIATYFGGSKGLNYKKHLINLRKHIEKNKINIFEKLFNSNNKYLVNETTSLNYSIGALLCDLAIRKKGKKALFKLMNSGVSDNELIKSIESIFNVKKENFNSFIEKELLYYD